MPVQKHPHIKITTAPETKNFTSTSSGGGSPRIPERNRAEHSQMLRTQLNTALETIESEVHEHNLSNTRKGIYLEFKGDEGKDLVSKSLEDTRVNVRLLNVHDNQDDEVVTATVFVPNEKKEFFLNKISQYETEDNPPSKKFPNGKPKHKDLIQSISSISYALVESFWSDPLNLIPEEESKWCEVWLRIDSPEEDISSFEILLEEHNIQSTPNVLYFPERAVKIVNANKKQLILLSRYSDHIAEYRLAKESASFWTELPPREQADWVNELTERIDVDLNTNISICILDRGINNGHPLLSPVLSDDDCLAVDILWGTYDHDRFGHGTMMAGVATYGDLVQCLSTAEPVGLHHKLESVKILPPPPEENHPRLWGAVTSQGISLAEIQAPERKRITCMAVTSSDTRDRGRPSSWSATIDNLTSGAEDDIQRLMILSAGNAKDFNNPANYPDALITDSIHDPAQSWNAITVGAYTALTTITDPMLAGYTSLAEHNTISPFTTTSSTWDKNSPIKPEIIMEGGNMAVHSTDIPTECADLSMLTTHFEPHRGHFTHFNMTSLATAQAAWLAAQIQVKYPEYWPETIRALMIHSATWTSELRSQFNDISLTEKQNIKNLLRICGYGVPSLERALHSASNSLTLILEEDIQPFIKEGSNSPKTKDMHFHKLPWPKDVLQSLPTDVEVEMRVTLSYFIEPGPGEIGGKDKYRYASHMLRFEINSPGETEEELIQRINAAERDEDNTHPGTSSASDHWLIGSQARNQGSVHSDIWTGSAADLADSNKIVVYPGIGWWRERRNLGKYNNQTRYSLIVSISTPSEDVDIYTPVLAQIETPVGIEIAF